MRFSSLALPRHLGRLAPLRAVTSSLPNITPRLSSSALQHLQVSQPFFFTYVFDLSAGKTLPRLPGVPLPGFGYPLSELSLANSLLEASFSSLRSWASLFRAFLRPRGHEILSNLTLHSCTPQKNLSASPPCFSGFLPPGQPFPTFAPRWFSSGQGLLLS
jgi:hypothetical protein